MKNIISSLALAIVTGTLVNLDPLPAQAGSTTFRCGTIANDTPATMAKTSLGEFVIIRWVSDRFEASGWDAQTRCTEVTQRFQTYYDAGQLQYITTGRMNRQPVICTTDREGGGCQNLLFTLKPNANANDTLKRLLYVRNYGTGALNETEDRVYINMEAFLEQAALEASTESETNESTSSIQQWWILVLGLIFQY